MNQDIILYSFLLLALLLVSRVYVTIARKKGIIDVPNNRSSHIGAVIRGGGILFYFSLLFYFIHSGFKDIWLFAGITTIAVLSFVDDIKNLSVKQRLPVQFLATGMILFQLYGNGAFSPFFVIVPLLLVGVVAINCYNFIDGINGMLGIYSLTTVLCFLYINWSEHIVDQKLLIFVGCSLVVFGIYNFRKKALFFSGDVGSMVLGLFFFYLATLFIFKLKAPVLLLIFGVYLSDTMFTIIKRRLGGKNIFEPHREHIYERLANIKKVGHLRISLLYSLVQIFLNVLAIALYHSTLETQWVVLAMVSGAMAMIYQYAHSVLSE